MHQRCARQPRPLGSLLLLPIWGPPAASHSPSLAVPCCWPCLGASLCPDLGEQGPTGHTMGIVARARCPWWLSPSCHPLRGAHQQCGLDLGMLSLLLPTLMIFFFPRGQVLEMPSNTRLAEQPPRCHLPVPSTATPLPGGLARFPEPGVPAEPPSLPDFSPGEAPWEHNNICTPKSGRIDPAAVSQRVDDAEP